MYFATWFDKAEVRDRTISQLRSVREVMELAGNHLFEARRLESSIDGKLFQLW